MPYDEIYSNGSVRHQYLRQLAALARQSPETRTRLIKKAKNLVQGDSNFLPLVRTMNVEEYAKIVEGVKQRGRAIQLFLNDHFFGDRSYERLSLFRRSTIKSIQSRYLFSHPPIALRKENLQFWYGPDIIRNNDGCFRVLEDNIGFVGGMGDLIALADASSILGTKVSSHCHPRSFYKKMVSSYRQEALRYGSKKIILLSYPKSQQANHEDLRFMRALGAAVSLVTDHRSVLIKPDGLYHLGRKVGFVIINVHTSDIDFSRSSRGPLAGFWNLVERGLVGVSYVPNLEFVGDKQFCPLVETLIKFYLNEECLLPALETINLQKFRSYGLLAESQESWVIKPSRGQGGKAVWIGAHLTKREWDRRLVVVEKNPSNYIAQRYCAPSEFLGLPVDIRPIAYVLPSREEVSPIAWGRAARSKSSKTNMARGGMFAPLIVR